ncbi:hypothetical protein CN613_28045, partial [Bacillus pseudomycoides]
MPDGELDDVLAAALEDVRVGLVRRGARGRVRLGRDLGAHPSGVHAVPRGLVLDDDAGEALAHLVECRADPGDPGLLVG